METCLANLEDLASLSNSTAVPATKQLVLTALLTLDVHGRDVISSLLKKDVSSENDFDWIRLVACFVLKICSHYVAYMRNEICCLLSSSTSLATRVNLAGSM